MAKPNPTPRALQPPPTALPLRRIAIIGTLAVLAGAWKSKPLLASFFTGPGSVSRIVCAVVVLANYKNFPLVWHVCNPFPRGNRRRKTREEKGEEEEEEGDRGNKG